MPKIHPTADVQSDQIGEHTVIWQCAVILRGAVIGDFCNINCHTFIEGNVVIGDSVTVKSGVYLWDGLRIGNRVFIGPNATFTNDDRPRSKQYPGSFAACVVGNGASIGANATIGPGVCIGAHAMVGMGSVVTRNVPAYALVYGNPARQHGWVDELGISLTAHIQRGCWQNESGKLYQETPNGLIAV